MSTLSRPDRTGAAVPTVPATPDSTDTPDSTESTDTVGSAALRRVLAAVRLSLGWVFLWAFLDKAFALGFDTGKDAKTGAVSRFGDGAWTHGGSPTKGFLGNATKGPLADFYHSFAGAAWADWLFMLGLLGIGLALVLGVAMRIAATAGALVLVLMWSAVLPPANNPFMDDHLVYALVLVALALAGAGRTWGLGRAYDRLSVVRRFPVLR